MLAENETLIDYQNRFKIKQKYFWFYIANKETYLKRQACYLLFEIISNILLLKLIEFSIVVTILVLSPAILFQS